MVKGGGVRKKNRKREREREEGWVSKERAIREIASVSVKATLAPATRATSTVREEGKRWWWWW